MQKKQIVFIEPKPTVYAYRMARSLRLTGRYETILVSFSEVDKKFFEKAYDRILILELSHKLKFKNFIDFLKKILSKEGRDFLKNLSNMEPYIFQITGPDLFSLMAVFLLKKNKSSKIYYSNDLWSADKRNFFITKEFWIKGEVQKFCEKRCFRMIDGVLNKKSIKEFELLNYKVNALKMALPPSCLDEWTFSPKKKKGKKIHIGYAGSAQDLGIEQISFIDIIRIITFQKIYFHTYGDCLNKKDNEIYIKEAKKNKYYILHKKIDPHGLNREMSKYNYGIIPHFFEPLKLDLNPSLLKTQLVAKMTNYIESGLPIIISDQCDYMIEIIDKYGLGFTIKLRDLKNLRKILEQKNYPELQKNIKKFQDKFKWNKKIKEIEEFYKKVIKMKNKKA